MIVLVKGGENGTDPPSQKTAVSRGPSKVSLTAMSRFPHGLGLIMKLGCAENGYERPGEAHTTSQSDATTASPNLLKRKASPQKILEISVRKRFDGTSCFELLFVSVERVFSSTFLVLLWSL